MYDTWPMFKFPRGRGCHALGTRLISEPPVVHMRTSDWTFPLNTLADVKSSFFRRLVIDIGVAWNNFDALLFK